MLISVPASTPLARLKSIKTGPLLGSIMIFQGKTLDNKLFEAIMPRRIPVLINNNSVKDVENGFFRILMDEKKIITIAFVQIIGKISCRSNKDKFEMGRAALKIAARDQGVEIKNMNIIIDKLKGGEISNHFGCIVGSWSISHCDGISFAAFCENNQLLGLDAEPTYRVVERSLLAHICPQISAPKSSVRRIKIWTIIESIGKATGRGLYNSHHINKIHEEKWSDGENLFDVRSFIVNLNGVKRIISLSTSQIEELD